MNRILAFAGTKQAGKNTAANYFHIEPIVDEKGLENLQNIQDLQRDGLIKLDKIINLLEKK